MRECDPGLESLLARVRRRLRPPVLIALGSPRQSARLVAELALPDTVCYQMDLFQADRLRGELAGAGPAAIVTTAADLWDMPGPFGAVLFLATAQGERELKRDMVEQAHHVLRPGGLLVVLSDVRRDQFFPPLLKKTYGKVAVEASEAGTVLCSPRGDDKPRRRHEISYHVRRPDADSLVIVSRPGVFGYGRLDDGARALTEVMDIHYGDNVLDIGCGTGAVGILAGLRAGGSGSVKFVDSNTRATALAGLNANAAGLTNYTTISGRRLEGLPDSAFDVALANPPYYAQQSIARLFVEGARRLLRPGGRLYLVTRQADLIEPIVHEHFGRSEMTLRRDYAVYRAKR
ncbi:MAG TPA: methyltransferase [Gemmataceae bacterium]|nr:methyltransferase [Gemmataceae bacterium]